MKLISEKDKALKIEISVVELGVIEQSMGVINGAYHLGDFDQKIGTKEDVIEKIRKRLRKEVEEYKTKKIILFSILKQELPWFINSIKFAMELAGEDEFQTLTGYTWKEAERTLSGLIAINVTN